MNLADAPYILKCVEDLLCRNLTTGTVPVVHRNENLRTEFLKDNELFDKSLKMLDSIRSRVDQAGYDLNAQKLREIIIEVVNEKENEALKKIEEEKKEEEEKLEAKKRKNKMTLTKFIDQYIQDVKDGTRTTLAQIIL